MEGISSCFAKRTEYIPDAPSTESHIAPQLAALVMRTVQMQRSSLDQPFDLQVHVSVDEAIEVPICVFERQRVRICEVGCDLKV